MTVKGERAAYGFFKNEYVRAFDSAAAANAAEKKVRAALQLNPSVTDLDAETAVLKVDDIEEGSDDSAQCVEEGFVFFKNEDGF